MCLCDTSKWHRSMTAKLNEQQMAWHLNLLNIFLAYTFPEWTPMTQTRIACHCVSLFRSVDPLLSYPSSFGVTTRICTQTNSEIKLTMGKKKTEGINDSGTPVKSSLKRKRAREEGEKRVSTFMRSSCVRVSSTGYLFQWQWIGNRNGCKCCSSQGAACVW